MNMYICDFVEVCAHVISLGGLLDAKVSCGRLIFVAGNLDEGVRREDSRASFLKMLFKSSSNSSILYSIVDVLLSLQVRVSYSSLRKLLTCFSHLKKLQ